MIVWLASYPRSGNTLLRILLNRAFGVKTVSLYDDLSDVGARQDVSDAVGHISHGLSPEQFREQARRSDDVYFAKTHELPDDHAKAIYVVRDGRAAIVSHYHYCQNFGHERETLSAIVKGEVWPYGWSAHVNAWALGHRRDTLLLRYEDLVTDNFKPLQSVANFLSLPAPKTSSVDFVELHEIFPKFFRSGSNAENIAELRGDNLKQFWALHGRTMRAMGYCDRRAGAVGQSKFSLGAFKKWLS